MEGIPELLKPSKYDPKDKPSPLEGLPFDKIFIDYNKYNKDFQKITSTNNYKYLSKESIFSKDSIENIFKIKDTENFKNIIKYHKSFLTPSLSSKGLILEARARITTDNIAEFAYPLAQYVDQTKPDFIIACDRGARMIGLAMAIMHGRLYGALPTLDHRVNFRKISASVPLPGLRETVRRDVERMLAEKEKPIVMVLDDWVASGATKDLVYKLFDELSGGKIKVLYAVMRGEGADISGSKDSKADTDWHDNPELIGVDYDLNGKSIVPQPRKVGSPRALEYRQRMVQGIDKFVEKLKAAEEAKKESAPVH